MPPSSIGPSLALRLGQVSHRVIASLVFGAVSAAAASDARAQTAPTPSAPAQTAPSQAALVQLPRISVEGLQQRPADSQDYKTDRPSSLKLTEPLVDTPQTIIVIPKAVMEDQGATSIKDALRYVPGITAMAGEGGGPQGDNFRIRGFAANTDIFIDGMRDIAQYGRDSFALESLEVVKGPSSTYSGRGSTGGSINQVTKAPTLERFYAGTAGLGLDNYMRATVDVNTPLSGLGMDAAAFRLNAVVHDSDVASRDVVDNKRKGIAPSLALGLGKPTRLTLNYFHLDEDNIPDYGLPTINGRVAPVSRSNFYGFAGLNTEETTSDVGTAVLEHDVNDNLMLGTRLRYGENSRYAIVSPPRNASLATNSLTHNPTGRDAKYNLLINQTDATARFATGWASHTLVAGVEFARDEFNNQPITFAGAATDNLTNPNPYTQFTGTRTLGNRTETEATTVAVYTSDTIKFGPQWEVVLGARWDQFDATTRTPATSTTLSRVDEMPSWRTAVVYKPTTNSSVYAGYGTSFNPSAEALAVSAGSTDPEESRSFEVGTKWDVMQNRLSLTAALFRTEKTNARTTDPIGNITVLQGEQRVDGIELGATGSITDRWKVFGGYTFQTSEIVRSLVAGETGKEIPNTPHHNIAMWSTYELPLGFTVGGGIQYISDRFTNNANTGLVDSYWLFDLMASYRVTQNIELQLNVYNLTDEFYIERLHSGGAHAVPGAGRTAILSSSFKF